MGSAECAALSTLNPRACRLCDSDEKLLLTLLPLPLHSGMKGTALSFTPLGPTQALPLAFSRFLSEAPWPRCSWSVPRVWVLRQWMTNELFTFWKVGMPFIWRGGCQMWTPQAESPHPMYPHKLGDVRKCHQRAPLYFLPSIAHWVLGDRNE